MTFLVRLDLFFELSEYHEESKPKALKFSYCQKFQRRKQIKKSKNVVLGL